MLFAFIFFNYWRTVPLQYTILPYLLLIFSYILYFNSLSHSFITVGSINIPTKSLQTLPCIIPSPSFHIHISCGSVSWNKFLSYFHNDTYIAQDCYKFWLIFFIMFSIKPNGMKLDNLNSDFLILSI